MRIRVLGGQVHTSPGDVQTREFVVVSGRIAAESGHGSSGTGNSEAGYSDAGYSDIADDDIAYDDMAYDDIDAAGASVVPLLVESVFSDDYGSTSPPPRNAFDLVEGNPATFAVIRRNVRASEIMNMLVVSPNDLIAVVVHGHLVVANGEPCRPSSADTLEPKDPRLGAWTDRGRDMTQYLNDQGRYSETRSGRPDAYTGQFWLDGDRITYLDDTGFWAFGQYHGGVLHHAGYVLEQGELQG